MSLYSLRYICSTPQKQPAARVAVCAPEGTVMGCAGALDIVLKGRRSLVRKDMEKRVGRRVTRKIVRDFRMAGLVAGEYEEKEMNGLRYVRR